MKTRADQIEALAKEYHHQNPLVWTHFRRFTRQAIHKGFQHYSTNTIFARIRWETDEADEFGKSTFKINNTYAPYYARWFMIKYPEHDGFFRTRRLISEDDEPTGLPELTPEDYDDD